MSDAQGQCGEPRAAAATEGARIEEELRSAALAVSSASSEAVFPELVRYLATLLKVEVAFIALVHAEDSCKLQMLAFWLDGQIRENFSYPMAGTPCETVLRQGYRAYPQELTRLFPLDTDFAALGVESYAGFPLTDGRGRTLGLMSVVSRRPLRDPERVHAILQIFAVRAAAELERLRAEEVLRSSEASYRAIFEAAEDAIFIHDWDTGSVVDVNPKACEIYGYSYDEMRHVTIAQLSSGMPPYTAEEALRRIAEAKLGRTVRFEWQRRSKDGSLHWDEVRLKTAVIGGKPRIVAFTRAITERKLAEEALRASEEQYRAIFDASADALVLWNSELQRVDINPAYERIYGFSRDEVLSGAYTERQSPEYAEQRRELVRRTLAGEACSVELESVRKDGVRIRAEVRTIPIRHRGQPHVLAISRDVTERKLAEEALQASEEQYRAIFNASVDGLLLWDAAHCIVDVNDAFAAMHGYRRDELVGQARPLFMPEALQSQCASLASGILAEHPCHIEARSLRKDGSSFDVEIHGVPVQYRGERHALVILRNISERKDREQELRRSEGRLRATVEAALDAVIGMDSAGNVIEFNAAAERCFGYRRAQVIGRQLADMVIPARFRDGHRAGMERYRRTGEGPYLGRRVEITAMRADGSEFPAELTIGVAPSRDGNIFIGFLRDITEQKSAGERLRESEERYRLLFEMESDAIILADADTLQHIDANRAALELYGYSRDEMLALRSSDVSAEPVKTRAAMHSGTGKTRVPLRYHRKKDGTVFPVDITANFFELQGRRIMLAAIRDVTERKRAEEERVRLEAQLQQAQKMEAIGQLTGGIAHDFNNILTSILGYIVLAGEHSADLGDARLGHYLEQAQRAAQRARDLIQQMLIFSRGQRGERRALRPAPLVRDSLQLLRSTLPSSIALHSDLDDGAPAVMVDSVQMEQVLFNLCINARDALGGTGEIRVGVRLADYSEAVCASCRESVRGRFIELAVADTGPGIAREVMDRMFEPFFSTKEVGRGSGMGLAMAHGIVHEHGGHILIDTAAERGTVFRVCLAPAATAAQAAHPSERPRHGASRRQRRLAGRVLVVEDERMVGQYMAELLGGWGVEATVIADPLAARAWFARDPSRVDAVVSDQTMPRMTGLALARALADARPALPVILYTGYGDAISDEELRACGACALLRKPVEPDALFELLQRHLPQQPAAEAQDAAAGS
jgi:PAS domain S-box-containing protein